MNLNNVAFPWRFSRWCFETHYQNNRKKNRSTIFKVFFSIFIVNVTIIVLLILIHQINDFFSVCLNFFKLHLYMVTISRSMSNSRPNTKKEKKANWTPLFGFVTKFT